MTWIGKNQWTSMQNMPRSLETETENKPEECGAR